MSKIIWSEDAWEDYLYWQTQDKKTIRRINLLIKDIERNGPVTGIGEPEGERWKQKTVSWEQTTPVKPFFIFSVSSTDLRDLCGLIQQAGIFMRVLFRQPCCAAEHPISCIVVHIFK